MTKAILEIEFDDEWLERIKKVWKTNMPFNEMFADVVIYKKESLENQCDYSQRLYRCWCPLKSIPKKKSTGLKDYEEELFNQGYNACIDKITGMGVERK